MVKIEAGRFYNTKSGGRIGPMEPYKGPGDWEYKWHTIDGTRLWRDDGTSGKCQPEFDIISEWQEGPIREVRRREIVPGVYGRISVRKNVDDGKLCIGLTNVAGHQMSDTAVSAEQLREAAHLFNQLAEVLEEQP